MSLISTVIPAYNAERFLHAAIESVLSQSIDLELIVVNDGSTDETAAIIASYGDRIRVINQPQSGLGAARNAGVRAARGELVAFLDADDVWAPDKLALQLAAISHEAAPDMVFGHCVEFTDTTENWKARTHPTPAYSACALLARRELFVEVGMFFENRSMGEFLDWYSRATALRKISCMLNEVVFFRRVHGHNMTRTSEGRRDQYLNVIRAHLQRTRANTDG